MSQDMRNIVGGAQSFVLSAEASTTLGLSDATPTDPFTIDDFRNALAGVPLGETRMAQQYALLASCAEAGTINEAGALRFFHRLTGDSLFGRQLWWRRTEEQAVGFVRHFLPAMAAWFREANAFAHHHVDPLPPGLPRSLGYPAMTAVGLIGSAADAFVEGAALWWKTAKAAKATGDPERNADAFFLGSMLAAQLLMLARLPMRTPCAPLPRMTPTGLAPAMVAGGEMAMTRALPLRVPFPGGLPEITGVMAMSRGDQTKRRHTRRSRRNNFQQRSVPGFKKAPPLTKQHKGWFAVLGKERIRAKLEEGVLVLRHGKERAYYDLKGRPLGSETAAHVIERAGAIDRIVVDGLEQRFWLSDEGFLVVEVGNRWSFFLRDGQRVPTDMPLALLHRTGTPHLFFEGRPASFALRGTNGFMARINGFEYCCSYSGYGGTRQRPFLLHGPQGLERVVIDNRPYHYAISDEGILLAQHGIELLAYDKRGRLMGGAIDRPAQLHYNGVPYLVVEGEAIPAMQLAENIHIIKHGSQHHFYFDGQRLPLPEGNVMLIRNPEGVPTIFAGGKMHKPLVRKVLYRKPKALFESTARKGAGRKGKPDERLYSLENEFLFEDESGALIELYQNAMNETGHRTRPFTGEALLYNTTERKCIGYAKEGKLYHLRAANDEFLWFARGEERLVIEVGKHHSSANPGPAWSSAPTIQ